MNKKSLKISYIFNIIILILSLLACIIMFTGFQFMEGEYVLASTKIGMLKFFTVDSNIFMGITALLFAVQEKKLLKEKISEISKRFYITKLMATTAVSLTFVIVFGYLGLIVEGGVIVLLMNSNLFFHLIIPILSVLTFVLFEKTDKLKFKNVIYGIVPAFIYGIFYLINILIHMENGKISTEYDWYWFVQGGVWQIIVVMPMLLGITYLISLILWRLNKLKRVE